MVIPGQVSFDVLSLTITPQEVNPGEKVEITAQVYNPGKISGYCNVTLLVNDVIESTVDVLVPAGDYKRVAFTTSKSAAGTYSVRIGQLTRSFRVKDIDIVPAAAPGPTNWSFYISTSLQVLAVALGIVAFIVWRKKHK